MNRNKIYGIITIIFFITSCNFNEKSHNNDILECIIDAYVSQFSMRLGNEISLFESHGWTDTSLNLSISTIASTRLSSGKYFYTEYKSSKLFLGQGELYKIDNEVQLALFKDRNRMVSNNLKWKLIEIKNIEEESPPPEEFDGLQIVYNTEKKCIEKSNMLGKEKFQQWLKTECGFCR
jgi:hypothetical protein